jgi:hypothetical protein
MCSNIPFSTVAAYTWLNRQWQLYITLLYSWTVLNFAHKVYLHFMWYSQETVISLTALNVDIGNAHAMCFLNWTFKYYLHIIYASKGWMKTSCKCFDTSKWTCHVRYYMYSKAVYWMKSTNTHSCSSGNMAGKSHSGQAVRLSFTMWRPCNTAQMGRVAVCQRAIQQAAHGTLVLTLLTHCWG